MFKAVHLQGRINIEILERSLNEIVHRHEILRTNFKEVEENPVQVIAPRCNSENFGCGLTRIIKTRTVRNNYNF
jgi:NRPS condensation-like uncharacterized protein